MRDERMREALQAAEECIVNFIGMYGDSGAGLILAQVRAALTPAGGGECGAGAAAFDALEKAAQVADEDLSAFHAADPAAKLAVELARLSCVAAIRRLAHTLKPEGLVAGADGGSAAGAASEAERLRCALRAIVGDIKDQEMFGQVQGWMRAIKHKALDALVEEETDDE